MGWPNIIPDTKRAPGWMKEPDAPRLLTPHPKRNGGVSAITKIAAQAPKKLVRTYRNAETLLAERARR